MTTTRRRDALPFNTPLETGLRSLAILVAAYPSVFDLQRLVVFDYLVVHTGDVGGPTSLHADVPLRSTELLVRRDLVERGLMLMLSKGLVTREPRSDGIVYGAGEAADVFLTSLTSRYALSLRERADWVVETYATMDEGLFQSVMRSNFDRWIAQFHVVQTAIGDTA